MDENKTEKMDENKTELATTAIQELVKPKRAKKFKTFLAPLFIGFWLALYLGVVLNRFNSLPEAVNIEDELTSPGRFVAERAERNLEILTLIAPRVVGSVQNEVHAVSFLTNEIQKIINNAPKDVNVIDYDVQKVTGGYVHWELVNNYRGIQNVIGRISPINSNSTKCVLVNTHFDTVTRSPGAGDDGSMVVVSLEVFRIMAMSKTPLKHCVMFLYNGAEENPLQGSHGFITQHKWAGAVQAVLNLDAAGNGGKEVLFQSGPNHPWIMKYYSENVKYPHGTTVAEEIFQSGILPSDTDFRIFRDFGHIPGLDMVYYRNGYQYHTQYDTIHNVPKESLQNTGDNLLAILTGIANAPELDNIAAYQGGNVVFYDILGWKLIFYTKSQGDQINLAVSVIALLTIVVSLGHIAEKAEASIISIAFKMTVVQILQIISVALAVGLAMGITFLMDYLHLTMAWYYNEWVVVCLYGCPVVFGLGLLPALYLTCTKYDRVSLSHRALMFAHAHCILLIVGLLALTYLNIRSAYLLMIAVLFYGGSLMFSLITTLHNRKCMWVLPGIVGQIVPFAYFTYLGSFILTTMIPMAARSGSGSNPDLRIGGLTAVVSLLSVGFLVPILHLFKKSKTLIFAFIVVTGLVIAFATTPAGFPFREKTASQRFYLLHARRVFHDVSGNVRRNEPVFYVFSQDRRTPDTIAEIAKIGQNLTVHTVASECNKEMACGFPYYHHRWFRSRTEGLYIPTTADPILPEIPTLTLLEKVANEPLGVVKYKFNLTGTDHMGILLQPTPNSRLIKWSFDPAMLSQNRTIPYFVYLASGIPGNAPYIFDLEFQRSDNVSSPSCEIGITAHWTHQLLPRSPVYGSFLEIFDKSAYLQHWCASYETRYY